MLEGHYLYSTGMKKRNILFLSLIILVIVAIGVGTYTLTRPETTTKSLSYGMTCLATNSTLTIPTNKRTVIEQLAMSHLYDVPAGTNVDVLLASYSKDQATGSARYPAKYGSYNFAMKKQTNGDWQFTKFDRCR